MSSAPAINTHFEQETTAPSHHHVQQPTGRTPGIKNRLSSQNTLPCPLDPPLLDISPPIKNPQQASPGIILLPAEIKNKIYQFVLSRDDGDDSKSHIALSPPADSCSDDRTRQDALLLTCRTIYHEAVGIPSSTETPLRFSRTQDLLRFLTETSPRRREGIRRVVFALVEENESDGALRDLIPILRALRKGGFPHLIGLEVVVHWTKMQGCGEVLGPVVRELGKMELLEEFCIRTIHGRGFMRDTKLRREVIGFVGEAVRAVPRLRGVEEVEVKGFWRGDG